MLTNWSDAWSIDSLCMFSGMTTYSMTLLKGKCLARLLAVGKAWTYCTIWWKGKIMDICEIWSKTGQDGGRIASENSCQKAAGNGRRLQRKLIKRWIYTVRRELKHALLWCCQDWERDYMLKRYDISDKIQYQLAFTNWHIVWLVQFLHKGSARGTKQTFQT